MTQVEAFWAGQRLLPGASVGPCAWESAPWPSQMPPHAKCQLPVTGAWELVLGAADVRGCHCPLANEALRPGLGPALCVATVWSVH